MNIFQITQDDINRSSTLTQDDLGKWCFLVQGCLQGFCTTKQAAVTQYQAVFGRDD